MKILFALGFVVSVTGCCCNKVIDESLKDISEYPKESFGESKVAPKYDDHFVACRPNPVEKSKVDSVVKAATDSGKDIVLYFHGGLSGQNYMINELGPALMESLFSEPAIKEKLYPVFINYDADPLQYFKGFYGNVAEALKKEAYKQLKNKLKEMLGLGDEKALEQADYEDLDVKAAMLIESFKNKDKYPLDKSIVINKEYVNKNQDYYIEILKAKELPEEFIQSNKGLFSELDSLASNLMALDKSSKAGEGVLELDVLDNNKAALRILRILARFALNSHHGFIATIQEEALDAIKVSKLGALHWNLVKRHAKQCFSEGSNGRAIVDALIEAKINIHTISHSAGSIPTAELINYISHNKPGFKLKNVVMLVPALNHDVFKEYVIKNTNSDGTHKAFDNLYAYSLTEAYEKRDEVFSDWLYSSSLLYAVSSLGEEQINLDQMLLINQHLDATRRPYDYSLYLKLGCEEPAEVWKYLNVASGNMIYYPFTKTEGPLPAEAATHESTKYPWVSWDLANDYIEKMTGIKLTGNVYKKMDIKNIESQW